jgi:hypothetical protein
MHAKPTIRWSCLLLVALGCVNLRSLAQPEPANTPAERPSLFAVAQNLPEAPSALLHLPRVPAELGVPLAAAEPALPALKVARKYHRVIQPKEYGLPLSATDKLKLSIFSRLTLGEAGATLFAAGFSQLRNSRPHYGTDSGAFGERLGGLSIKQTSQSFFGYGVFAAALHDDPRYYVVGPSRPIVRRALYSARDLVITRKDDGRAAINWPRFAGIAAATALTNFYYPADDHGFGKSADAFAASLGTSLLNNEMHEFTGDAMRLVRHRH